MRDYAKTRTSADSLGIVRLVTATERRLSSAPDCISVARSISCFFRGTVTTKIFSSDNHRVKLMEQYYCSKNKHVLLSFH